MKLNDIKGDVPTFLLKLERSLRLESKREEGTVFSVFTYYKDPSLYIALFYIITSLYSRTTGSNINLFRVYHSSSKLARNFYSASI